jgi:predicted GNAT family acetyltransferase
VHVSDAPQITDNPERSRLEITADGHLADLRYRRNGNRLVIIHTGVPAELEGRGLGGRLVTAAVDRAARDGMIIVPLCPFARDWLQRHPDTASRAPIDWGNRPATSPDDVQGR